ncbi:MAG: preprotein translocase subunit SecE [Solirubrobacterales bacterium]
MARNRQKAKARKAKREATGVPAGAGVGNGSAGAPPTDEGTVKAAAAVDAAEVRRAARDDEAKAAKAAKTAGAPKQRGRFRTFLRSSWAELRRVQWPDRAQITTLTSIVIGFVIIAGVYLGVIDWVANKVVDQIIF